MRAVARALAYDGLVEERAACAQLKQRFEAAGFHIKENQLFDEDGVRFEIDGFDADRRVGYEYITEEAGDGWDVDDDVIAERRTRGELHVLIVDEADAPDKTSLDQAIDEFLEDLHERGVRAGAPAPAQPAAPAKADGEAPAKPVPAGKAAKKKARKSK